MSDRPDIFSLEQIRLFDIMWGWKDALKGDGYLAQTFYGKLTPALQGFFATQTATPSNTINLAQGVCLQQDPTDNTPWAGLGSDGQVITQTGYYPGGQLALAPTVASGQSQWILIQVGFQQIDAIRAGDPTNGVLPYVNVDNPAQPLAGPGGNNQAQNTVRQAVAVVEPKYGVPASGTPVAPTADAGFSPLYLILYSFGQSGILTSDIDVAGPSVVGGYAHAPLFPGVTGTIQGASTGSHHGGVDGQANKIDAATELSGIIPFSALPVSNANPPALGGHILAAGQIPIISISDIDPTGNIAGNAEDFVYNFTTKQLWLCVQSGSAGTAVWDGVGIGGIVQVKNANFTVQPGNFIYLVDTGGGDITATLPAASTMGGTGFSIKNIGANELIMQPAAGEQIERAGNNNPVNVRGDNARQCAPQSGYGFFFMT